MRTDQHTIQRIKQETLGAVLRIEEAGRGMKVLGRIEKLRHADVNFIPTHLPPLPQLVADGDDQCTAETKQQKPGVDVLETHYPLTGFVTEIFQRGYKPVSFTE